MHACMYTDVKDDKGQSPLDKALNNLNRLYNDDRVDIALYLMSRGCGGDEHKAKVLLEACRMGKLGVVKELVELHKVDPKSECDVLLNGLFIDVISSVSILNYPVSLHGTYCPVNLLLPSLLYRHTFFSKYF